MSLKQEIQSSLREAMQQKDVNQVSVLRMLLAAVLTKEKEKRAKLSKAGAKLEQLDELSKLDEKEILSVISSEAKKRKDSIEQYKKGGRKDLADQEEKELGILNNYLPEPMDKKEIKKIVEAKIKELGATSPQDIGRVMGQVMPALNDRADGGLVKRIVEEELA